MPPTDDPFLARRFSSHHREALQRSTGCGCFFCLALFLPEQIEDWWDDGQTAVCPQCGTDSVVGDADVALTPALLAEMKRQWFED